MITKYTANKIFQACCKTTEKKKATIGSKTLMNKEQEKNVQTKITQQIPNCQVTKEEKNEALLLNQMSPAFKCHPSRKAAFPSLAPSGDLGAPSPHDNATLGALRRTSPLSGSPNRHLRTSCPAGDGTPAPPKPKTESEFHGRVGGNQANSAAPDNGTDKTLEFTCLMQKGTKREPGLLFPWIQAFVTRRLTSNLPSNEEREESS
ncbi:uncharacterized protein LOC127380785 [Apus apus]|uniref:uncharacterized protein LOC127380785 n=1 Tax=Apus apus TaxID=8895 RepID=UPI0021F8260C|nr:uncharacterized protein LOC127380785 [Apus apus]